MLNRILRFVLLAGMLLPALSSQAQFTNVTALVKDANNNPYANCSYSVDFVNRSTLPQLPLIDGVGQFQTSFSGARCDAAGNLAVTVADNNRITPNDVVSQWRFSICDQTGKACFTAQLTITGATQDITATLQAASVPLPGTTLGNATASSLAVSGNVTVGGTLSAATITATGLVSAFSSSGSQIGKYSTLSSAIAAAGTSGGILADPSTYNDNLSITAGQVAVSGWSDAQASSTLQPATPATDLIKIDATSSGATSGTSVKNLDLTCPSGACGNMATITGSQTTNQPNDFINFKRVYSSQFGINSTGTAGFANGVVVTGRLIFGTFDNIRINNTRGDGFRVTQTGGLVGPFNANTIQNSQFFGNFGYGFKLDTAGAVTPAEANTIMNTNIELNGGNTALSPCAGAIILGAWHTNFFHNSFENNCVGTTDVNAAHIRITGTTTVPWYTNVVGNNFEMTAGAQHYGIYADATRSGGVILGNRFAQSGFTAMVHIAATSLDSLWEIGVNQGMGKADVVPDGGNYTHVTAPVFGVVGDYFVLGNSGTSCTSGAIFDMVNGCSQGHQVNNIVLSGPNFTWTNFQNTMIGSWILVQNAIGNTYTLQNNAAGAGHFISRDGNNIVLANTGDAVMFRTDFNGNLQEVFRSATSMANTWTQNQTFTGNVIQSGAKSVQSGTVGYSINGGTLISGQNSNGGANTNWVTSATTAPYVGVASDFTTANNTNHQAITGLTWTFPAIAGNYNFSCNILYQQNTAAASVFFGIQAATNNPTNINAVGHMSTAANGSAADGTLVGLATTTATTIVNGTPSASGTVFLAILGGRIELGASANTVNITTATSVGADSVTIKRGSSCQLF